MKIKGLLSELDEIRAQRETAGLQSDHVSVTTSYYFINTYNVTCNVEARFFPNILFPHFPPEVF